MMIHHHLWWIFVLPTPSCPGGRAEEFPLLSIFMLHVVTPAVGQKCSTWYCCCLVLLLSDLLWGEIPRERLLARCCALLSVSSGVRLCSRACSVSRISCAPSCALPGLAMCCIGCSRALDMCSITGFWMMCFCRSVRCSASFPQRIKRPPTMGGFQEFILVAMQCAMRTGRLSSTKKNWDVIAHRRACLLEFWIKFSRVSSTQKTCFQTQKC